MNIQSNIKSYYGEKLQTSSDLQTDACCTIEDVPAYLKPLMANIHPDVSSQYYGCGLIAPLALRGARVLDLGCGTGKDAFTLAQLVGAEGQVIGVDMTPAQIAVAREHADWHAEKFGFANVDFLDGDIEDLGALDLEPNSFDVVISNCVINLVADKGPVFRAVKNLLKPGGEFYFADVYADRRLSDELRGDSVLQGECLGGALYWNDFLTIAKNAGFADPRLVTDRPLTINNPELVERLFPTKFHSATYRLFNIDGLETACEDYGQAVIYRGGLENSESAFELDNHHFIERDKVFPVCGNTYRMLSDSRFARYFEFIGDMSHHYGIFPGCGVASPFGDEDPANAVSGACC